MTLLSVKKLTYYVPLARASCETCREPVVYNLPAGVLQHDDPEQDQVCAEPWPEVSYPALEVES